MPTEVETTTIIDSKLLVETVLATVEREREREIIARRFGLFDRKETLEQIGELLGITRERVRQLEKSVIARLRATAEAGELPSIVDLQATTLRLVQEQGGAARITALSAVLTESNTKTDQSRVAFLLSLCPVLVSVDEHDDFYQAVAEQGTFDSEKAVKTAIAQVVDAIKQAGEPHQISIIAKALGRDATQTEALARISKKLATLGGVWGLTKWPTVNPKNIRDKIYVILKENTKPMHFGDIAEAIKASDFKRKDVTTQAIHNELIKDKRFVLVGRGIYALKEWGFSKGTVSDIIADILREAAMPLHRDEIVKRVLRSRYVKETTILLNLQGKPQFKRVAKATYELAEVAVQA
jgi:predicted DCC family thiol-disulfide oxidoreductase YuxK